MKRHYLYLSLICLALVALLVAWLWLVNPRPGRQVGYIPPAPPSAAPIVLSPTPTATELPTWTPTPTAQPSSTPTTTIKPSSTPTAIFALPPDTDTRGDAPASSPATGGNMDAEMNILNGLIGLLVSAVIGGALARGLEQWERFRDWKPPDPNIKMITILALTALVGGSLVWVQQYAIPQFWQFVPVEMRTLVVCICAFAVSQYWHQNDKQGEARAQAKLDTALGPPTFNVTLGNRMDMEQLARALENAWHRGK